MDKLLLDVVCAATAKHYDFWIPRRMSVGEALGLVAQEIRAYEQDEQLLSGAPPTFYAVRLRALLDPARTMEECGVSGADELLIF